MCLFKLIFYEKYDWSNHSMIKCKFKKVNNWTTTTYAPMRAFDYFELLIIKNAILFRSLWNFTDTMGVYFYTFCKTFK